MADKVLINLATGMEDGERVLVAFLVATAAVAQGKQVVVWTTKDAVRLGLPGEMAASYARTARRSNDYSSSSSTEAANSGCARSASPHVTSQTPRSSRTPKSWERHRCGSGQEATRRSSATNATEREGRWQLM